MSFEAFINWLATASVVITAFNLYFMVNKIWSRKHIRDVAESISVAAYSMSFLLGVPFMIKFLMLEVDLVAAVACGLWMVFYAIFVLIGTGVWVVSKPGLGFLQKFRRALSTERNELGTIVKAFSKPTASNHVLRILGGVAGIGLLSLPGGLRRAWEKTHGPLRRTIASAIDGVRHRSAMDHKPVETK